MGLEHALLLSVLACVFALFMAWGIGANDVANAMATSVGSKALTLRQAVIIAAIFEFTGAFLAGGEVTNTVRGGMVEPGAFADEPALLAYGMMASLLAAGTWLFVASRYGWPVSTTHCIIGAIVGFAAVGVGVHAVQWGGIGIIAASWVISPLVAGAAAFLLFLSVRRLVLNKPEPFQAARRAVPLYIFVTGFVVALMTATRGLRHVGIDPTTGQSYGLALLVGLAAMAIGIVMIRRIHPDPAADRRFHFTSVERLFGVLMLFTACAMAFAHGSNDVANAVGPVAAVLAVVDTGSVTAEAPMPPWVLLLGGVGIVAGLVTYGKRVMATVGSGVTELTPSRGFAATLAAAGTVTLASGAGLPISTTHALVGAILGVGLARGIGALNLRVVRIIFMSWVVTLPAGGVLSVLFFVILRAVFG